MRRILIVVPILALLVFSFAVTGRAQVAHAGNEGKIPLTVGAGWSNFSPDWGDNPRQSGITVWADYRFQGLPGSLKGFGLSAEGEHLAWGAPELGNHKMDAGLGGASYRYPRWDRVRPYLKFMIGFGGVSFENAVDPNYTHDTRTIYAPGGGADIHAWKNFEVRVDYEYQFWPDMFRDHSLNPSGFTLGAVWDFGIRPGYGQ
jgi:opacity protein-like surface antigen